MVKTIAFPKEFSMPHTLSGMPPETPILVAYSGGADSSLLLHLLHTYAQKYGTPLYAAHLHHGIRGQEADRDLALCENVCHSLGIPFFSCRVDIPALARESGRSLEEEGRYRRYEFFETIMRENNVPLLATAHNLDDNAETLLFRMARGAGPGGLGGIPPTRDFPGGRIVRPLLGLSKASVLALCHGAGIEFATDSTNLDTAFARNRIRRDVLPALCEINEAAPRHLAELGRLLSEDEEYLSSCAREALSKAWRDGNLSLPELAKLPGALARRVWMLYLESAGFTPEKKVIEALLLLTRHPSGEAAIALPGGKTIRVKGDCVGLDALPREAPTDYLIPLSPGLTPIENTPFALLWEQDPRREEFVGSYENIYKKETTVILNSATIEGHIFVRPRKPFDVIFSGGHHKKVKKLLCDGKVDASVRNSFPLLCDDSGILWIPGVAARDGTKVTNSPLFRFTLLHKI